MSKQPRAPRGGRTTGTAVQGAEAGSQGSRPQQSAAPVARVRPTRRQVAARARRRALLLFVALPVLIVVVLVAILIEINNPSTVGMVDAGKLHPGAQVLRVGTKAPDFTLATTGGKKYTLSSFRGRPVLLEFFAVWCPHCQREAAILNRIDQGFGPRGLQTLAVLASPYGKDYDTSGASDLRIVNKGDVAWFEQSFEVGHPTLIDPTFATVNAYNASSYPTIYVLDKRGIVRYADTGEQPYAALAAAATSAAK